MNTGPSGATSGPAVFNGSHQPDSAALIGISTDGRAIAVDAAPHILVCSGTGGGSTTILHTLTAQFLHQGAHALVLDYTRIAHLWAKDLPTVTHRGNVAGIHDALVGLGSELERRIALDGDLDGVPRLMVVIDRADDMLRHLARYWETFRQEDDPQRSPAIAALEAVLYAGRAARIHVLYDGPTTVGDRLIPGAREQVSTVVLAGPAPAPGSGSPP
ncbi:hypothetical protein [Streptomyces sp. NRRL B-3648]|uniref:hypothetical protein n=1 Tax=Streptomyces sp. NRRL B-3648 TaxID=1519493 RepID=UPI0006B02F05|nr:hypothetical protein [Streptomyces sp. NRRL B-3648]KOV91034.1 hypothetical protein ADL04_35265 [Streptomyces sp. NRRL B-3648]